MKRIALATVCALVLAGCGADGEPVQPTANVGIGVSGNGVSVGTTVGVKNGPINISIGGFF